MKINFENNNETLEVGDIIQVDEDILLLVITDDDYDEYHLVELNTMSMYERGCLSISDILKAYDGSIKAIYKSNKIELTIK